MPQVNVLPVNISKNIELKDESVSFDSTESKEDFSRYIDLHLNKNKEPENSSKVDGTKSEATITKNSDSAKESKSDSKKSKELVENSAVSDEAGSENLVPKVAASGKEGQLKSDETDQKALLESEQLMSFLTKADNTLTNQQTNNQQAKSSSTTPAPEQLSAEQKAHNEAQLLLNASKLVTDLSPVAKALGSEQVDEPLAQKSTDKGVSAKEKPLNDAAKVSSNENTRANLSDGLVIEGKNKADTQTEAPLSIVKSVEKKAIISDLKAEVKPEAKPGTATQIITDVKETNTSSDKANAAQQAPNQVLLSDTEGKKGLGAKNNDNVGVSAEQKIAKQMKTDSAQMSTEHALKKEVIQNGEQGELAQSQFSDKDKINANAITQPTNNRQAQSDAEKSLGNKVDEIATPVALSKQVQADKNSNLSDAQLTKRELTPSSEISTANEKVNQTVANLKKAESPNNQFTSNDISHEEANKMQAKQDEKAQLAAKNEGELVVEAKPKASANRESSANGHFIDVSGRTTQTPQQIIEQQSAEMLNPSVATEVTQSQKTNGQLHQETISMFRKDFTDAVKDKVMLMISQKLQRFDITLDPPELGNMQVRVNLQGEQAAVSFIVQSQQTKDALEQNMHKLRELLAEQGVDVGDANVEQQSQQSANEDGSPTQNNNHMEGDIDNIADANDVVAHTLSAQMIDSSTTSVDYYA